MSDDVVSVEISDDEEEEKVDVGDTFIKGTGIKSIVKTSTNGLVDTYTITYTDLSTNTFEVTNGKDSEVLEAFLSGFTMIKSFKSAIPFVIYEIYITAKNFVEVWDNFYNNKGKLCYYHDNDSDIIIPINAKVSKKSNTDINGNTVEGQSRLSITTVITWNGYYIERTVSAVYTGTNTTSFTDEQIDEIENSLKVTDEDIKQIISKDDLDSEIETLNTSISNINDEIVNINDNTTTINDNITAINEKDITQDERITNLENLSYSDLFEVIDKQWLITSNKIKGKSNKVMQKNFILGSKIAELAFSKKPIMYSSSGINVNAINSIFFIVGNLWMQDGTPTSDNYYTFTMQYSCVLPNGYLIYRYVNTYCYIDDLGNPPVSYDELTDDQITELNSNICINEEKIIAMKNLAMTIDWATYSDEGEYSGYDYDAMSTLDGLVNS